MKQTLYRAGIGAGVALALTLSAVPLGADATTHDWPQFRGLDRDGISRETGLLERWPESGPPELWRRPIGEGYSGIAVVGDRLYTMYGIDAEGDDGEAIEVAVALDAGSGKELWRTTIGEKHDTEFGNGPRATPTVDGDTVYVLGSKGTLAALGTADGAERWRLDLKERFGASMPYWGYSTSPLVDGDRLIVEAGGPEGKSYVALDKKSGETVWSIGDAGAGYNSPLLVKMGDKRRIVYVSGTKLMCIDPEGKEIWSHDWPQGETHAMPVYVAPNKIYASGAEGVGAALVEVEKDESAVRELWKTARMKNHFNAAVVHGGHLYGFDNATLKAISLEDGEMAWGKRGLGKGSLILADGNLIVLSDRGKLLLLEATPEGYVEKGSFQALDGRSWTPPALAGGRLFVRNHTEIVAYDLGASR